MKLKIVMLTISLVYSVRCSEWIEISLISKKPEYIPSSRIQVNNSFYDLKLLPDSINTQTDILNDFDNNTDCVNSPTINRHPSISECTSSENENENEEIGWKVTELHKTFVEKSPTNKKEKIGAINKIKKSALIQIYTTINHMWLNNSLQRRRIRRESKHHSLGFPSSESALMTIGFLTFAVYLIKLVLQVINVLKVKKSMYFTPMVTSAGKYV